LRRLREQADRRGESLRLRLLSSSAGASVAAPLPAPVPADDRLRNPRYREILAHFLEDLAQAGGELGEAAAAEDVESLARLAHRLHGTAGSFGFAEVSARAGELESALRSGASVADSAPHVEGLSTSVSDALRAGHAQIEAHGSSDY
jgi:HPt (histidine-containing phosphotransfer) domain-containing protein